MKKRPRRHFKGCSWLKRQQRGGYLESGLPCLTLGNLSVVAVIHFFSKIVLLRDSTKYYSSETTERKAANLLVDVGATAASSNLRLSTNLTTTITMAEKGQHIRCSSSLARAGRARFAHMIIVKDSKLALCSP